MYAGIFAFLCSTALLVVLSPVSDTLVKLLTLSTDYPAVVLASPVTGIGAAVWWAVVERRNRYTYLSGGATGLLAALLTVVCWVLLFTFVWGPLTVLTGGVLILFVLVVFVPAASVAGVLLMSVRRRTADSSTAP